MPVLNLWGKRKEEQGTRGNRLIFLRLEASVSIIDYRYNMPRVEVCPQLGCLFALTLQS